MTDHHEHSGLDELSPEDEAFLDSLRTTLERSIEPAPPELQARVAQHIRSQLAPPRPMSWGATAAVSAAAFLSLVLDRPFQMTLAHTLAVLVLGLAYGWLLREMLSHAASGQEPAPSGVGPIG